MRRDEVMEIDAGYREQVRDGGGVSEGPLGAPNSRTSSCTHPRRPGASSSNYKGVYLQDAQQHSQVFVSLIYSSLPPSISLSYFLLPHLHPS